MQCSNLYRHIRGPIGHQSFKRKNKTTDRTIHINIIKCHPDWQTDFSECICQCPYTNTQFKAKDGIVLGAIIPEVNHSYLCHPNATSARKQSKILFDISEANCNTCIHLQRIPHKNRDSMKGYCNSESFKPYILQRNNHISQIPLFSIENNKITISFHPDERE
jgi:hypothetical protein